MRKVLIISYYWPPSGGSGVQRWLKFSKYLPKYGWLPIIYTPENPYYEIFDDKLLEDISKEIEIWKTPIWEPYNLKNKVFGKRSRTQSTGIISNRNSFKNIMFNWIRGNMYIPDPKIHWVKPSVNFLQDKIKNEEIEYIITTGPPHSMHLIGLELKKIFLNLKWIADFRDPWSELDLLDEFHLNNRSRKKHKELERQVLRIADCCLTVSESWVKDLKRLGASSVELITNGFDAENFKFSVEKDDKFIIGHYGLLNHLRNPKKLWNILNKICEENPEFSSNLEIHLSGNIDNDILTNIKSYPYLRDKLKNLGYLSHSDVLEQYMKTSLLLLLLFNTKSGIGNYPGKIFEYFAAKRPILAFGPENSDTKRLINKTDTGFYFSFDDENFQKAILDVYNNKYRFKQLEIDRFSREHLTGELSRLLNRL